MATTIKQAGLTITPQEEAVAYFVGLMLVYLASYNPISGSPAILRTVFGLLGTLAIIVKYELSTQPKPQITSHQALLSGIALALVTIAGQISADYSSVWYAGLVVAVIGSGIAAYEDLGGKVPAVTA